MKVFDGNWKAFVARTMVFGVVVFGAVRLAVARDGVAGGPARSFVTVAGTLTGVSGATPTTFEFRRAGSPAVLCAPQVTITTGAGGAFSVPVPLDQPELPATARCPDDLFDGRDVQVRVLISGNEVATWAPVNPVPYARFADQSGVANAARRPGPYGLTLAYDATPTSPTYGQLCVQCNNQSCSATNPGFIAFGGPLAGQIVVDRFTTNTCIRDAHSTSSDFAGHPWLM